MNREHQPDQDNIGYENTEIRANEDDKENDRMQTTDTNNGDGNKPEADTGKDFDDSNETGLRSESGKKTMGKEEDKE